MFFGTFVDKDLDWIDTVHFPDVAKRYPINNSGFYKITAKLQKILVCIVLKFQK